MILATTAILQALADGAIVCDPAPARVEGAHIDIALGAHYWVWRVNGPPAFPPLYLDDAIPEMCYTQVFALAHVEIPAHGKILAHTEEYIGVASDAGLVPMLHTRSTLARWFLSVCTANAGQGDPQYCSRWTLEIINPHSIAIAIPVGARIGSISFHRLEGAATPYQPGTRYNATRAQWQPSDMLPKRANW